MPSLRIGPPPAPPLKPPRVRPPAPEKGLFEQLFPAAWRGIVFPISSMKVSLSQDLVEHKYWGVDAANVEATGRAPMQIEAEIPFVNGIVPGKSEHFGVLYPTTFREFLKAFADSSSGVLNHPELSGILCKPHSLDFALDAHRRDGVIVTARWTETVDPDQDVKPALENESPIQAADLAALDLDASKDDILKLAPEGAFPEETFDSLINKLSGFVDSVGITAALLFNKPAQIINRVKTLQESVERTKNVLTWPVTDSCERMKEALRNLGNHTVIGTGPAAAPAGVSSRKIGRYTTATKITLAGIAGSLPFPNSADDLIALNPFLLAKPQVQAGTVVRYYAS